MGSWAANMSTLFAEPRAGLPEPDALSQGPKLVKVECSDVVLRATDACYLSDRIGGQSVMSHGQPEHGG